MQKNERLKADLKSTLAAEEAKRVLFQELAKKGTIKKRLPYIFSICGKFGLK